MTEYQFTHETKEVSSKTPVAVTEIPPAWSAALDNAYAHSREHHTNPVIEFPTAKEAALHLAYAKAWGRSKPEGHQITVIKTHRKTDKEGTLRLSMEPFNPNAPKRGRTPKASA